VSVDQEWLMELAKLLKRPKGSQVASLKASLESSASKTSCAAQEMLDLELAIASSLHPDRFSRHAS
jgi:hypothetical protein